VCCPTCWQCEDKAYAASNKICNENDDPVCPKGIWTGTDCAVPVDPIDRIVVIIIIVVCPADAKPQAGTCPAKPWEDQAIRLKIASYTSVTSDYITTTFDGVIPDDLECCYKWKIIVTAESTDSFKPDAEFDNMINDITTKGSADGISVEMNGDSTSNPSASSDPKKNDATHVIAGWLAALFALLACCF